jgi:hypothetical protein
MVLPGFNTDFKYKGLVYHAQTEDNGIGNPVIVTLMYLKGAILASKKTSYADLLKTGNYQQELMEIMKAQHREVMRDVLAGKYESAPAPEPGKEAAAEEPPPSEAGEEIAVSGDLDSEIMAYLERFATESKRGF